MKDLIIAALECAADDAKVPAIAKSFINVKAYADFDANANATNPEDNVLDEAKTSPTEPLIPGSAHPIIAPIHQKVGLSLGYTINLNLPKTTNPEVYSQIFKTLKEELYLMSDLHNKVRLFTQHQHIENSLQSLQLKLGIDIGHSAKGANAVM